MIEPSFYGLPLDQYVDIAQTVAIIVAILYVGIGFRQSRAESQRIAESLKALGASQQAVQDAYKDTAARIERIWRRIDAIESRQGIRADVGQIAEMKRILDAIKSALTVNDNVNP